MEEIVKRFEWMALDGPARCAPRSRDAPRCYLEVPAQFPAKRREHAGTRPSVTSRVADDGLGGERPFEEPSQHGVHLGVRMHADDQISMAVAVEHRQLLAG